MVHLLDGASIPRRNPHLDPAVEGHEADIHKPGQPLVAETFSLLEPPESFDPIHITRVYDLFIKISRAEIGGVAEIGWVKLNPRGLPQKGNKPKKRLSNLAQGNTTKTQRRTVK